MTCSFVASPLTQAAGSFTSVVTDKDVASVMHAVCIAPVFSLQKFSLYIYIYVYTLYMICLVLSKCMMELHGGITSNTDSCTSFCVGKESLL